MYYCEGKYCSIRNECTHHHISESDGVRQYLDQSTQGFGYYGEDENGKKFSHHEYICGDRAPKYSSFKNKADMNQERQTASIEDWVKLGYTVPEAKELMEALKIYK